MISDSGRKRTITLIMLLAVLAMAFACLFVGSSRMSFSDCIQALLNRSTASVKETTETIIEIPNTF